MIKGVIVQFTYDFFRHFAAKVFVLLCLHSLLGINHGMLLVTLSNIHSIIFSGANFGSILN